VLEEGLVAQRTGGVFALSHSDGQLGLVGLQEERGQGGKGTGYFFFYLSADLPCVPGWGILTDMPRIGRGPPAAVVTHVLNRGKGLRCVEPRRGWRGGREGD